MILLLIAIIKLIVYLLFISLVPFTLLYLAIRNNYIDHNGLAVPMLFVIWILIVTRVSKNLYASQHSSNKIDHMQNK